MTRTLLLVVLLLCTKSLASEQDIIDYAAAHPRGVQRVQQPDGSYKESKYGDYKLAEAEAFLSAKYPRPWTVSKALDWFEQASDDVSRAHLMRLLAASRDSRAALFLGERLTSPSLSLRVAATYGLLDYFLPGTVEGGTEQHMEAARVWFDQNQQQLHDTQTK